MHANMRTKFIFISLIAIILALTGCISEKPQQKVEISFKQQGNVGKVVPSEIAYQMKQQGDDIILVDVREKEEWYAEHIPGAIWIPHSKLKEKDKELAFFYEQHLPNLKKL